MAVAPPRSTSRPWPTRTRAPSLRWSPLASPTTDESRGGRRRGRRWSGPAGRAGRAWAAARRSCAGGAPSRGGVAPAGIRRTRRATRSRWPGRSACACSPVRRGPGPSWTRRWPGGTCRDDDAAEVLDRYSDVGMIDDEAFARAWVTQPAPQQGAGPAGARRRAAPQGGRRRDVGAALDELDGDTEGRTARELVDRRLRRPPAGAGGTGAAGRDAGAQGLPGRRWRIGWSGRSSRDGSERQRRA